jgi:predicted O-methyltransferase YrrM
MANQPDLHHGVTGPCPGGYNAGYSVAMAGPMTYVRGIRRAAVATGENLKAADRAERVKRAVRDWAFMYESSAIPVVFPDTIWPGIGTIEAAVRLDMSSSFELPIAERALLVGLVRLKEPKVIFEFGTFTGSTTVLLAAAAPADAVVHTIDLPESAFPPGGFDGWFRSELVGQAFDRATCSDRHKIISHRADLADFDFKEFTGCADIVFVDADHSYESVLRDTRFAYRIATPGGTIVWDDYHPTHWGSVRALNYVARDQPLVRIAGTRLVACQLPPPAGAVGR